MKPAHLVASIASAPAASPARVRIAAGQLLRAHLPWLLAMLAAVMLAPRPASAAADPADPHAHHRLALPGTKRSIVDYKVPDVTLVRDDGRRVSLASEMNDDRPVVLAFIYTSCTSVCPIVSRVLADLQDKLGAARDKVHLMSISIDPEHDTPSVLRAYAQRFGAGPGWQHYTGTIAASQAAQRAFDVYRGDKMSHAPAVLVRPLPGARWTRIDGFAKAEELLTELPESCLQRTASR